MKKRRTSSNESAVHSFNDQILAIRVVVNVGVFLITSQHANSCVGQTAAGTIEAKVSIDRVVTSLRLYTEGDILCRGAVQSASGGIGDAGFRLVFSESFGDNFLTNLCTIELG